jgi:hypothetical protein
MFYVGNRNRDIDSDVISLPPVKGEGKDGGCKLDSSFGRVRLYPLPDLPP